MIGVIAARAANSRSKSLQIAFDNVLEIAMTECWICGNAQRNASGLCQTCRFDERRIIERANRTVVQHLYDVVYALSLNLGLAALASLTLAADRMMSRGFYGPTGIMLAHQRSGR